MKRAFWVTVLAVAIGTGAVGADKSVEDKLKQLEQEWAQAGVKGDTSVLERIEANDFVFTDPAGVVGDKAKDISDLKTGQFKAAAIDLDDVKVRVFGKVAIVTGRTTIRDGKYQGQDISGQYRFTDVWMNRGNQWQVIASQGTQIMKK